MLRMVLGSLGLVIAGVCAALDRLLERWGFTPPRLELTDEVAGDLARIFGDSLDPRQPVIRLGSVPRIPHTRAFALPGVVYLARDQGIVPRKDPAGGETRMRATPTLVHELVHVWQGRRRGHRYIPEALIEQIRYGRRAYDWESFLDADRSAGWADLPVEAQAQLVTHAYALGEIAGAPPAYDDSCGPVRASCAPDAFADSRRRAILSAALDDLRAPGNSAG